MLQALSKDKLYPKIEFFAPGFGANNDPIRGYILVFFISLGCVLIGNYLLQVFIYVVLPFFDHYATDNSTDYLPTICFFIIWSFDWTEFVM